jgi:serine/threonine protein kinase
MLDIKEFLASNKLFDGRYRLLRALSTDGGTADVWLALDVNTIDGYPLNEEDPMPIDESSGIQVAIKIYRPKNALDIEGEKRFREEFKIAYNCHHSNLLQPTGFNIFEGIPYLVLPYCEAGSAEQFIGQRLPDERIWKFIHDVASGLDRLHSNQPQIIHQDIKPANILIDDNGNFTITDFGISARNSSGQGSDNEDEENSGTMAYMAPERFQRDATPIPPSDIWALGATLCEILAGRVPFGEEGGINQINGKMSMPALSGLSSDLRHLIQSCLQKDPNKRPTAHNIIEIAQNRKKKKPWLPILITLGILSIAGILYFATNKEETTEEETTVIADYAHAEELLSNGSSAQQGLELLQSLVDQKDYKATFLMSRLYFDTSDDRDTLFYDKSWKSMRAYCGIKTDNVVSHDLLMQAFQLNEDDYVLLYQLGSDFLSGDRRGCERNLAYALWCFEQGEKTLANEPGPRANLYREYFHKGKLKTEGFTPKKPQIE